MTKTERLEELKIKLNIELAETVLEQEIAIGRLRKRISKLVEQRDHYKEERDYFEKILKQFPYARRSFEERQIVDHQLKHYREIKTTHDLLVNENERLTRELTKLKYGVKEEKS